MTKFYFAISLKSKQNSDNWELVIANLKQTLTSIKNSSCQNYQIVIATNDPEDLESIIDTNKTTLVHADFDAPKLKTQQGGSDKLKKRRLIGSHLAKMDINPFYVMFLDADDLIHKDLIDCVLSDNNRRGYLISDGYVLDIAEGELRRKNEFYTICGSCYIGYFYPEDLPKLPDDMECYYSKHHGPGSHIKIATRNGREPENVPFPGVVYIRGHEESLQTEKKRYKIHKNKILHICMYFSLIERNIRLIKNKTNNSEYIENSNKAKKMLEKCYGLYNIPELRIIIIGKRKLRFLNLIAKKVYDTIYKKTKYMEKK